MTSLIKMAMQLNRQSGWLQFNKHLLDCKNHFQWNFLQSQGAYNKKKKGGV